MNKIIKLTVVALMCSLGIFLSGCTKNEAKSTTNNTNNTTTTEASPTEPIPEFHIEDYLKIFEWGESASDATSKAELLTYETEKIAPQYMFGLPYDFVYDESCFPTKELCDQRIKELSDGKYYPTSYYYKETGVLYAIGYGFNLDTYDREDIIKAMEKTLGPYHEKVTSMYDHIIYVWYMDNDIIIIEVANTAYIIDNSKMKYLIYDSLFFYDIPGFKYDVQMPN